MIPFPIVEEFHLPEEPAPVPKPAAPPAGFSKVYETCLLREHMRRLEQALDARREDAALAAIDAALADFRCGRGADDEIIRVLGERARAEARKNEVDETRQQSAFSIQKLILSLLKKLGAEAPVIPEGDHAATGILLDALRARQQGARRLFARDSDLFAMPRFPIVRLPAD